MKARVLLMDAREEGFEEGIKEGKLERDSLKAEVERLRGEIEELKKTAEIV